MKQLEYESNISVGWTVLLGLATFVLLVKAFTYQSSGLKYPPGPPRWPLLGNTAFLSRMFKDMDASLKKIAKDYGGLCMLWMGRKPFLIISKAETAKQLLDKVCLKHKTPE